jgi:hypothetical protein
VQDDGTSQRTCSTIVEQISRRFDTRDPSDCAERSRIDCQAIRYDARRCENIRCHTTSHRAGIALADNVWKDSVFTFTANVREKEMLQELGVSSSGMACPLDKSALQALNG